MAPGLAAILFKNISAQVLQVCCQLFSECSHCHKLLVPAKGRFSHVKFIYAAVIDVTVREGHSRKHV